MSDSPYNEITKMQFCCQQKLKVLTVLSRFAHLILKELVRVAVDNAWEMKLVNTWEKWSDNDQLLATPSPKGSSSLVGRNQERARLS